VGIGLFRAAVVLLAVTSSAPAQLRFCIRTDPATFDPLLAEEEAAETIAYLTNGVLIRLNRSTQKMEPELANSWKVRDQGKRIDFLLRSDVRFSDGTPFGPEDVIATVRRLANPDLHSSIGDTFRSAGGTIRAELNGAHSVSVFFATTVAGLDLLFDQLPISSARRPPADGPVLGPFLRADYKSGQYILLRRNPYYWKMDGSGTKLPHLDSIRIYIQSNREIELLRFGRGELHWIDKLEPEAFERLRKDLPAATRNAGSSLDAEFFWFNQTLNSKLPPHVKGWFQSKLFRQAMSAAVNRDDIIRLVYHGYAHPAAGPVSASNHFWFNSRLHPTAYDPARALELLRKDGFQMDGRTLRDRTGHAVEFSLITNAGSQTRARIGAMVQQDLKQVGIQIHFMPVEFQSLIERITRTQQYEACLLGLTNVEVDPNAQMNVWPSSGTHHAWNPAQANPATPWEAEIDRLMQLQHTVIAAKTRKETFDRVQEIVAEQVPIVYLVNPDVLVAVAPAVRGAAPSALPPHLFWNIDDLSLAAATSERKR
jgi:peptide/nickel transport system substrate-binding protein